MKEKDISKKNNTKLYPFKLLRLDNLNMADKEGEAEKSISPDRKMEEVYHIVDFADYSSKIQNGWLKDNTIEELLEMYLEEIVGARAFSYYGRQFPVMVKTLRLKGSQLPLTVHPNDEIAFQRYDALGKAKIWYVQEVGPDAIVYMGLAQAMNAEEFYANCVSANMAARMYKISPKKGDVFFIPPGLLHSASGNLNLLEVAESSPLDFNLCHIETQVRDTEEPISLSSEFETALQEAFDFIDLSSYNVNVLYRPSENNKSRIIRPLASLPEFKVNAISLKEDALHLYAKDFDSFLFYLCLEGCVEILYSKEKMSLEPADIKKDENFIEHLELKEGEAILIPADFGDFIIKNTNKNMETLVFEVTSGSKMEAMSSLNDNCSCTCSSGCSCGHNCDCGSECTCGDDCTCGGDCDCGDDCNCHCKDDCTCGGDCNCKNCDCS